MFELGCMSFVTLVMIVLLSGCSTFQSNSQGTAISESILSSALTAAATILQNNGTQEYAVAFAESLVAQQIEDPEQQEVFNNVIESALPQLMNSIAGASTSTKDRSINNKFVRNEKFDQVLADSIQKYKDEVNK